MCSARRPGLDVPAELREAIINDSCVLGLGAGVSIGDSGVPSGRQLASEIARLSGDIGFRIVVEPDGIPFEKLRE